MKTDSLNKRVRLLESKIPDEEDHRSREFLGKLTYEELDRLEGICLRTDEWKLTLTEEEAAFIDDLRARYWPVA